MGSKNREYTYINREYTRRGKGLFYGIKLATKHARGSTLSALHAFARSGRRFEGIRKTVKQ